MTDFEQLQQRAWEIADDKGFHPGPPGEDTRGRPQILALIHSEVSEALEADRENDDALYAEELADVIIRVLDHVESEGIDLEREIKEKMDVNEDREEKHGKKY
jgi:NTP pyrophosphatase (non-canonical NTP hydrolase)